MTLDEYIRVSPRGTIDAICKQMKVSRTTIYVWRKGLKKPLPEKARMLEKLTKEQVKIESFFGKERGSEIRKLWSANDRY